MSRTVYAAGVGLALTLMLVYFLSTVDCSSWTGDIDDNGIDGLSVGHSGPAWEWDGRGSVIVFGWQPRLASVDGSEKGSLYSVRGDGTDLTLLSESSGDGRELGGDRYAFDTSPALAPDGRQVSYATLRHGGYYQIAVAALDGSSRRQLTKDPPVHSAPAWSPDGARLAFVTHGELHTMAADGTDTRVIVSGFTGLYGPPRWSPDGESLAFRARCWDCSSTALYIVGADGSGLDLIVDTVDYTSRVVGNVAWSPDGRQIAFPGRGERGREVLAVVDIETRTVRVLVEASPKAILWSPDGSQIIYGEGSELHALRAWGSDSVWQKLTLGVNEIEGLALSPGGDRIAVLVRPFSNPTHPLAGSGRGVLLYTLSLDGSDTQVLVRSGVDGPEAEVAP